MQCRYVKGKRKVEKEKTSEICNLPRKQLALCVAELNNPCSVLTCKSTTAVASNRELLQQTNKPSKTFSLTYFCLIIIQSSRYDNHKNGAHNMYDEMCQRHVCY